jgi:hypothetical protein
VAAAATISGAAMSNDMADLPPFHGNPAGARPPLSSRQRVAIEPAHPAHFHLTYPAFRQAAPE